MSSDVIKECKCDNCGKNFVLTYQYAFKIQHKGLTKYFCKYTCMCRFRETVARKRIKKRREYVN